MDKRLILCKIKRGNETRLIWLPENLAHFGKKILLVDEKNQNDDRGWLVIRVKKMFSSQKVKEVERQIRIAA